MTTLRRLWITDAPLTFTGLVMIGALAAMWAGLWFDPRVAPGLASFAMQDELSGLFRLGSHSHHPFQ